MFQIVFNSDLNQSRQKWRRVSSRWMCVRNTKFRASSVISEWWSNASRAAPVRWGGSWCRLLELLGLFTSFSSTSGGDQGHWRQQWSTGARCWPQERLKIFHHWHRARAEQWEGEQQWAAAVLTDWRWACQVTDPVEWVTLDKCCLSHTHSLQHKSQSKQES